MYELLILGNSCSSCPHQPSRFQHLSIFLIITQLTFSSVRAIVNKHVLIMREVTVILKFYFAFGMSVAVPFWLRYFDR